MVLGGVPVSAASSPMRTSSTPLTFHPTGRLMVAGMDTPVTAPRPDSLVDALSAAFLDLSAEEQRLMVALYRTLLRGRPATIGELAAASGWAPDELGDRLRRWPGVFFDSEGRVVGFWGVATEETSSHRVEMD